MVERNKEQRGLKSILGFIFNFFKELSEEELCAASCILHFVQLQGNIASKLGHMYMQICIHTKFPISGVCLFKL